MSTGVTRTLVVAMMVAVVCSLLVSITATLLKPLQIKNRSLEKKRNVLVAAGIYDPNRPVNEQFDGIEPLLVELKSGTWQTLDDPDSFIRQYDAMMKDPERSRTLPPEQDPADVRVIPLSQLVYRVSGTDGETLVLPVWGKGLWSTMYGFLALDTETMEIKGFSIYQHGETPGLGGEVDNESWKNLWPGKRLFDPSGELKIQVIKGRVETDDPDAVHKIDGLSGATITTRGVHEFVRFWLGPDGFGPMLDRIRAGDGGQQ